MGNGEISRARREKAGMCRQGTKNQGQDVVRSNPGDIHNARATPDLTRAIPADDGIVDAGITLNYIP